jgi:hypothetical protein
VHRLTLGALLPLLLGSCVSPFVEAKLGRMSASVHTVWVGENKFVFVPAWSGSTFKFETARIFAVGLRASLHHSRLDLLWTALLRRPRFAERKTLQ